MKPFLTFVVICICSSLSAQILQSDSEEFTITYDNVYLTNCDGFWSNAQFTFSGHPELTIDFEVNAYSLCDDPLYGGGYEGPFIHVIDQGFNEAYVDFLSSDCFNCDPSGLVVSALGQSQLVGPGANWGGNTIFHDSQPDPLDPFGYSFYYAINGHVGFRALLDGQYHYGYFELNTTPGYTDIEVHFGQCFINLTPNETIAVGQTPEVCVGDADGDGQTGVGDFIMLNSAYGTVCDDCPQDFNGDGVVDVDDFLTLNSAFGQTCE